ncbi:MAG: response regulator, partial [Rhodospirillales bacterium]|nr:response regulator [Rhodospirillales bacterium]
MSAKRVLIVEDDPIESLGLDDMMKHLGYEVTAIAISGEAAIGMAAQDRPDLVLMDILLAGRVNGIEAARKIRDTQHVPIIFVSACGTKPQGGSAEI